MNDRSYSYSARLHWYPDLSCPVCGGEVNSWDKRCSRALCYDYETSVEKLETEHHREAHKQYMKLTGGSYCACVVGSNGYQGGWYQVKYDVNTCIQCQCQNPACAIRKKPRDLKKVNIFYDVRRVWITYRGFLEEKKVTLTKGLKVFDHAVAQTDAEIWLKIKEHGASPLNNYAVIEHPKKTLEDRRQEYFSHMHRLYDDLYDYFEFHYEVENIRIARSGQRDLLQDLRDAAEGIEVAHNIDLLKEKAGCQSTPQGVEGGPGTTHGPAAQARRNTIMYVLGQTKTGVNKMENSKLMTPLFYGGSFNREGHRMRAVLEKEISNGTQTYRLWRSAGKPEREYRMENVSDRVCFTVQFSREI